jgi:hypothetical protein
MAGGAGRLKPNLSATLAVDTENNAAASGLSMPRDSGVTKPFLSQGRTGSGFVRSQAAAASSTFSAGATSSTSPSLSASDGLYGLPPSKTSSAFFAPIMRGRRWVPPDPGSSPTPTSGNPTTAFGSSARTRLWHANASSYPPPRAKPFSAATTGLPIVSNARCIRVAFWLKAYASLGVRVRYASTRKVRSAPAMKDFLADVTMTPETLTSAFISAIAADISSSQSGETTFMLSPTLFSVSVAMPSSLCKLMWRMALIKSVR